MLSKKYIKIDKANQEASIKEGKQIGIVTKYSISYIRVSTKKQTKAEASGIENRRKNIKDGYMSIQNIKIQMESNLQIQEFLVEVKIAKKVH